MFPRYTDTLLLGLGDSTECTTVDSTMESAGVGAGEVCQFPFTWRNTTYTGCTAVDGPMDRHSGVRDFKGRFPPFGLR